MYGGRAIDDFDRRVLRTYMNEYMGDFIFDTFQPFYFHRTDDVAYYIPTANQEQAPATGLPPKEASLGKQKQLFCRFAWYIFNFEIECRFSEASKRK